jgi:hypothetical protein
VQTLGNLGSNELAYRTLSETLGDRDAITAQLAAQAVGNMGKTTKDPAFQKRIHDDLVERLGKDAVKNPNEVANAITALARMGAVEPGVIGRLAALLRDNEVKTRAPVVITAATNFLLPISQDHHYAKRLLSELDRKLTSASGKVNDRYCEYFPILMKEDHIYRIDLMSKDFDAYVYVEDERKTILDRDDDSGGNLNSRLFFTPAATGTYYIRATTFSPGQTGNYQLTVWELPKTKQ